MFCLSIFLLFCLCLYLRIKCKWKFVKDEYSFPYGFFWITLLLCCSVCVSFCILISDVTETNYLKAQNIHMLPKDLLEKNIAVKNAELNDIKSQIKKAGDKNQFQVQIQNLNGISIYTMPMSANGTSFQGLGDVERGGAEKLKLLENLIEKQREIANELIQAQKELSREEYYKRNAKIMVYENSLFDGILVRWFSIKSNQNLNLIENRVYYPKEK